MPPVIEAIPAVLAAGAGTAGGGFDLGALLGGLFGGGAAAAAPAAIGGLDLATIPGAAVAGDLAAPALAGGIAADTAAAAGGDLGILGGATALDLGAGVGGAAGVGAAGAPLDLAGAVTAPTVANAAALPTAGGALGAAGGAPAIAAPASVGGIGGGADLTSLLSAPASTATQAADLTAATAPAASSGFDISGLIGKASPLQLAGTGIGAGGLIYDLLKGNQKPPNYNQLEAQAGQAGQQATQLESYLTSGQLPSGLQASLDSAKQAAIASIKSQYAGRGMTGSSAEAQDIAGVNEQIVSQGANIAMGLYNTGLSQAQLSDQIYAELMNTMVQQDAQMSSAVGNFAGALALSGTRAA